MTEPSTNNHYSLADIEKYLQGKMTASEMHALEKAALQDPFLADAIEGFADTDISKAQQHLEENKAKILAEKKEDAIVVPMQSNKKSWLRIAAAVVGIAGVATITMYVMNIQKSTNGELATTNTNKPAEISNGAKDTTAIAALTETQQKLDVKKGSGNVSVPASSSQANLTDVDGRLDDISHKEVDKMEVPANLPTTTSAAPMVKDAYHAEDAAKAQSNWSNNGSKEFRGRVVNTQGEPLANATISANVNNRRISQNSDANGFFSMPLTDSIVTASANVSSLGYLQQNYSLSTTRNNNIVLQADKDNLDEVVVNGYATKKKAEVAASSNTVSNTVIASAKPEGGWQSFYDYVALKVARGDSAELYHGREIDVEFEVDKNGRPVKIQPANIGDEHLSKKAAELMKNGPNWIIEPKNRKAKVTIRL